jgi:6-phosphogluconolactonase
MEQFFFFPNPAELARQFAENFRHWLDQQPPGPVTVCLSGGSTPTRIFELWASDYAEVIDWSRVHFFWGDERCVPPDSSESNYGTAKRLWLEPVGIPAANIHPMPAWLEPNLACELYEQEILKFVSDKPHHGPCFDLILLGMGTDGHIASLFPHQLELIHSQRICEIAEHPDSGQRRITLTGTVINQARRIAFLITGQDKQPVFRVYRQQLPGWDQLPISHVRGERIDFFLEDCVSSAAGIREKQ